MNQKKSKINDDSKNRQYYNASHLKDEKYLQMPRWLMEDEEFSNLSNDAKVLYTVLKDRFRLSARNRWIDKQGRVFVICKRETMMDILHRSKSTVIRLIDELEKVDLIEDVRRGLNKPNFIYLLMPKLSSKPEPAYDEDDWQYDEQGDSLDYSYDEHYSENNRKSKFDTSEGSVLTPPMEVSELDPNKNNFSMEKNNNLSFNEQSIAKERENEYSRFEEYIKENRPFKYLNFSDFYEIMEKRTNADACRYALCHLRVNDFVEKKVIKQFLSLMADILSCEEEYYVASRNKKYKAVSFKQRLLLIDENLFAGILSDLEEVESIHSLKPYLTELLYNAPINSSSNILKHKDYSKLTLS